jgi:iron complex outermembrane receptor protein
VTDVETGTFNTVLGNAGKSRSQGFEIEATARPSREFSVAANFTLVDATIDVLGQSCPIQLQTGVPTYSGGFPVNQCYIRSTTAGTSSPIIDIVGGQLPATPRYRVGVTPRYEREFGNLAGFVQVALNYQSATIFALNQDPLLKQDGYAIVDASIGLRQADSRWNVTLFVRNLFDRTYYSQLNHGTVLANATNGTDLWANINKDADRYFGATFGVKF